MACLFPQESCPLVASDGRAVGGLNGFGDGSSWHWGVGHWHGRLAGALPEETPVGGPVFALDGGGHGGAAQGQGKRSARPWCQCPAHSMGLLWQEGAHGKSRAHEIPASFPCRLARLHATDVQGRDLDRRPGDLLVCHVLVYETVHAPMHLLQVHLLVLERAREGREKGKEGGFLRTLKLHAKFVCSCFLFLLFDFLLGQSSTIKGPVRIACVASN